MKNTFLAKTSAGTTELFPPNKKADMFRRLYAALSRFLLPKKSVGVRFVEEFLEIYERGAFGYLEAEASIETLPYTDHEYIWKGVELGFDHEWRLANTAGLTVKESKKCMKKYEALMRKIAAIRRWQRNIVREAEMALITEKMKAQLGETGESYDK